MFGMVNVVVVYCGDFVVVMVIMLLLFCGLHGENFW